MARGGKRATREEGMRAVLEKWERSGLPLARFADREGIAHKTMYRWLALYTTPSINYTILNKK